MRVISWGEFARVEPALAAYGTDRLRRPPAYLATVRSNGEPRVHPVTPILTAEGLFVFMEPTSPKAEDLRRRGMFALHNGVPDTEGSGGEFFVSGRGFEVDDGAVRQGAVEAASYDPSDDYVLFELKIGEARGKAYGDVAVPERARWRAAPR
jgi:hypothetical protein